jgi:hypothetical protein
MSSPRARFNDIRIGQVNGDPLFSVKAVATLKAGITSLHVDANLASIRPGRYVLQLRRAGSDWSSYPLYIKWLVCVVG